MAKQAKRYKQQNSTRIAPKTAKCSSTTSTATATALKDNPMPHKCECPEEGVLNPGMASWYDGEAELPFVNHEPNQCKCTNSVMQYERNGKKLWLCSCCNLSGDKLVNPQPK